MYCTSCGMISTDTTGMVYCPLCGKRLGQHIRGLAEGLRWRVGYVVEVLSSDSEAGALKYKLTDEEVEAGRFKPHNRQMGYELRDFSRDKEWSDLVADMMPGDELWEFVTSDRSWNMRAGRAGIALVRGGKAIDAIITLLN